MYTVYVFILSRELPSRYEININIFEIIDRLIYAFIYSDELSSRYDISLNIFEIIN